MFYLEYLKGRQIVIFRMMFRPVVIEEVVRGIIFGRCFLGIFEIRTQPLKPSLRIPNAYLLCLLVGVFWYVQFPVVAVISSFFYFISILGIPNAYRKFSFILSCS
jgi:hypothetical protein